MTSTDRHTISMLHELVRSAIRQWNLIERGDRIIVGVSGGPDSLALLLALKALSPEYHLSLLAAHVDHMLRDSSSVDARFVRRFCDNLGLTVTTKKSMSGAWQNTVL